MRNSYKITVVMLAVIIGCCGCAGTVEQNKKEEAETGIIEESYI